ncbi:MAG: hypothetical protein COA43_08915 [Robiginitomaculum sp.]|nr:MAG: hypothetical protein COA43_08915 [Robiginitomaculum sp.]
MKQRILSIEDVLDQVTTSRVFGSSNRQLNLLRYLLSEKQAGREKQISGYKIAIEVLGRPKDFDNNADSIVRVEMHRLRKNLVLFNADSKALNITIPKASYDVCVTKTPTTLSQGKRPPLSSFFIALSLITICVLSAVLIYKIIFRAHKTAHISHLCSQEIPNLLLLPTRIIGSTQLGKEVGLTIDNHLQTGFIQYPLINTISGEVNCTRVEPPLYHLKAEVFMAPQNTFVSVIIQYVDTRQIIFSEKIYIQNQKNILTESTSIALYKIAAKTAHLNGVVSHDAIQRPWQDSIYKTTYECLIKASKATSLANTPDRDKEAVNCMEAAIDSGSISPDLYGTLAHFYLNQVAGYQTPFTKSPIEKVEKLLIQAEMIAPLNPRVLSSRARLESERVPINLERLQFFVYALERQQPFNPHTLILTSHLAGYKIGDWEFAKKISDRAKKLDRTDSYLLYYIDAGYDFLFADPQDAYLTMQKLYFRGSVITLLLKLASANKADDTSHTQHYKQELASLGYPDNASYIAFIKKRQYEPVISKELIKWLAATK